MAEQKGMYPNLPPQDLPGAPPQYQPPPMQMQQPQQPTTVIVQQPSFGPDPIHMVCPQCQTQTQTQVEKSPKAMAWVIGGLLCLCGFWPCACIPCCLESMTSATHKCSNCKKVLGKYNV